MRGSGLAAIVVGLAVLSTPAVAAEAA